MKRVVYTEQELMCAKHAHNRIGFLKSKYGNNLLNASYHPLSQTLTYSYEMIWDDITGFIVSQYKNMFHMPFESPFLYSVPNNPHHVTDTTKQQATCIS